MRTLRFGLTTLPLALVAAFAACSSDNPSGGNTTEAPSAGPDGGTTVQEGGSSNVDPDAGDARANVDSGPDAGKPPFALRLNGDVYALHHAGNSWFLGGDFTAVNGTVMPGFGLLGLDGSVVRACDPTEGVEGSINAIARTQTAIFLGGQFSTYRGQAVQGLAKIDAATCSLDTTFSIPGNGLSGAGGYVNALTIVGNSIYVGGYFTNYRGVANAAVGLAKLDITTGAIDTTFSPPGPTQNGVGVGYFVYALAASNDSLYVGGFINAYRGVANSARHLVKVDLATGAPDTTFSPPGATSNGFDQYVGALLVNGNSLYVGGAFTNYRGSNSAFKLAKLDRTTGALDTTFTKSTGGIGGDSVRALAAAGSSLYVAGSFALYRGAPANNIAKVDLTSGLLDTTFSPASGPNGADAEVLALAVNNNAVYAGGDFQRYRGVSAPHIAKVDPTSGVMDTSFNPTGETARGFNRDVRALAIEGSTLAVGGYFDHYAGMAVNRIAKVDDVQFRLDGTFTGDGSGFDSTVTAITSSGNAIYVGGAFTGYRGAANAARHIAKLDATTGALDGTFSPPGAGANGFDSAVLSLTVFNGSIYAGGSFSAYRGVANSANRLAKLDPTTGVLDSAFSPVGPTSNGMDGPVMALAGSPGALFVGGDFSAYRGVSNSANRVAKLNPTTGALDTTFSPSGTNGFDYDVASFAIVGNSLFVGGDFTQYRGVQDTARAIAKLDLTTGALDTTFYPTSATGGFDSSVYALAASGNSVFAGGSMRKYRNVNDSAFGIAKLDTSNGNIDTTFSPAGPNANGVNDQVFAIGVDGTSILFAGDFTRYRGKSHLRVVRVNVATGTEE